MSIYMSKKISVPAEIVIRCVSVNCIDGFIAIGGDQGYLRVLRIDNKSSQNSSEKNVAASLATANNLTMNQILEGHKASVVVVSWNEKHQKLTSGDEKGNIIVWILMKSTWCEEMVNTRNSSVVKDVRWTSDGLKICIVYEDGDTIVGSVDGNRIWGKNLKGKLNCVEWSPDGRKILFGMNESEVHVYDSMGNHIKSLAYQGPKSKLANICWYNGNGGFARSMSPCLAVAFKNGKCQLMRDEYGTEPLELETGFTKIVTCHWNDNGTLIGILGSSEGGKYSLNIFNTMGQMVSKLCMPGKETTCFSWDRGSIRLAVGVDSFLYLANYRLSYRWCHLKDTIVFSHSKLHEAEDLIVFWDIRRDMATVKSEKNLLYIMGCDDFCCMVTQSSISEVEDDDEIILGSPSAFTLTLMNSIGTPLDSKVVDMPLKNYSMSSSHLCVASESAFYVWQFKNIKQLSTIEVSGKKKAGIEKLLHVDDVASGVGGENIDWKKADLETDDPISCLCLSNTLLIVGRSSGILQVYILQNIMLQNKYTVKCRPVNIQLNCDSSCLSIIDDQSMLSFFKINDDNKSISDGFTKKDVWSFLWAKDNPASFVLMEKTKMQIFNNSEPEEAIPSSGYLCVFADLTVTSIFLDDLMTVSRFGGELFSCREFICHHEAKSLKDLRNIVDEAGFDAGMKYADSHSHRKLWKILANYALEKLDLKSAELCFARAKSLTGIRFVKRLSNLQNDGIRKAEIATFYSNFDDAERIYLGLDRRDLAMAMRNKMGDYMKEVKLMEGGGWGVGDRGKREAYNKLADYHADMQQWGKAAQYYREGHNEEKLIGCYFALEDYDALKQMLSELPDEHDILPELGRRFVMVGMCQEAVQSYLKCHQIEKAIDACVQLNQWNVAIELGHTHNKSEVDDKLIKYMQAVMDTNKLFEAVELYRKSNHFLEASKILFQMAELNGKSKSNPLLIKKLYLLSALLVEKHHDHNKQLVRNKSKKKENEASLALKGLLEEGAAGSLDSKVLTQAWKCVEAYHFLMLAHRQLYKGDYESAMMTSLHLREFDDILDPVDIYSLLALTSFACKSIDVCSEAFMRLETLKTLSEDQRKLYEELAVEIFYRNMKDYKPKEIVCSGCHVRIPFTCTLCPHCNTKFLSCISSGRLINAYQAWCCPCCKRCAMEEEISRSMKACPMCHQSF